MANITAADVNKLRQITGAGMMDCKKALVEAEGDFDKAIEFLRKKGQKVANNRADREAKDGFVFAKTNENKDFGVIIMLNCETDFVAKSKDFVEVGNAIVDKAIELKPNDVETLRNLAVNGITINDLISDLIGKVGEKIELTHYHFISTPFVASYNHNGNRLASLLGFTKNVANTDELGKQVAMQIAAMNPIAIDKDDVDTKTIENEIEIGKEQARLEGKAEAMLEKIAAGKLNKFLKENTLLNQLFIMDETKTVAQYLESFDKDLKVKEYKRLVLGV